MAMRRILRTGIVLAAAYLVALHTILLAVTIPAPGFDLFGQPICSAPYQSGQAPNAPAGREHDCLAACLAAGCGLHAPALTPGSAGSVNACWDKGRSIGLARCADAAAIAPVAGDYDSRAPPLG